MVVAIAPEYVERMVGRLNDRPVEFFVFGLVAFVAFVVLVFVLAVTVVGLLGLVVFVPAAIVVGIVSHALVSTWIGRAILPSETGLVGNYLVAGVILFVVSLVSVLGDLVTFVLCASRRLPEASSPAAPPPVASGTQSRALAGRAFTLSGGEAVRFVDKRWVHM